MQSVTMKRYILIVVSSLLCSANAFGWGQWGHMHINKAAVFALPVEMRSFFYNHIDFMVEEAVVPDIRKYTLNDKAEFARHYINIEDYHIPINGLPVSMADAKAKYSDSMLNKCGMLPWYMQLMMQKLTNAMKEGRRAEILLLAADLGHYVGDAHMPLHTSSNHNGQLTNQQGIHAFWESQLPEMFGAQYDFYTGDAKYVDNVNKETWSIVAHSFSLADILLATERQVHSSFSADKIYVLASDGKPLKNMFNQQVYSKAYAKAYHDALKGMVEQQMRAAIIELANFWYTAWVNAGKPDLNKLDDEQTINRNKKFLDEDYELWRSGKCIVNETNEFPQL